jgi:hypothetical protein
MFTIGRDRRIVRTTQAETALAGRRVADVMVRDPVTVSDDMPRTGSSTTCSSPAGTPPTRSSAPAVM